MKEAKRFLAFFLATVLVFSMVPGSTVEGKKKKKAGKVSSVKFTNVEKKLRLQKGKKFRLKTSVKVKPNKSKYKKLKFTSSNRKTVLVNSRGLLKGKKVGTAKVTAVSRENLKKKATVSVSVTEDVLVKSIKLNRSTITVDEFNEEDIQLEVKKILPSNAKNKEIEWSTSNEDVADVDDEGVVTSGDVGTAVITATAADQGGAMATCKVVVEGNQDKDDEKEETDIPGTAQPPQNTAQPQPTSQSQTTQAGEPSSSADAPAATPAGEVPVETITPPLSEKPRELYFTDRIRPDLSEVGITAVADQDGTPCTQIHFTRQNQRTFFELPEDIDLDDYNIISIQANVVGQLSLAVFGTNLDKTQRKDNGAEKDWWEEYTFQWYPFYGGSKGPDSQEGIETEMFVIADHLGECEEKSRYISIGSNQGNFKLPQNELDYFIYSVTLYSRKEGVSDLVLKSNSENIGTSVTPAPPAMTAAPATPEPFASAAPATPKPFEGQIIIPQTDTYEIVIAKDNETGATKDKDSYRTNVVFENGSVSYTNTMAYNSGMVFAAAPNGDRVDLSGFDYIEVDFSGPKSVMLVAYNDASSWWNKFEAYVDGTSTGRRTIRFQISNLVNIGLKINEVDGIGIGSFGKDYLDQSVTIYSIRAIKEE